MLSFTDDCHLLVLDGTASLSRHQLFRSEILDL